MGDLIIKPASSGSLKIQDQAGTNFITTGTSSGLTLGSGVTFPTHHVIQVVYFETSALDSTTTNYASGFDDSDIVTTITPNSATNYLLMHAVVNGGNEASAYAIAFRFHISGGGTDGVVGVPTAGVGNRVEVTAGGPQPTGAQQVTNYSFVKRVRCNDSIPNWSSGALTIKIQFATNSGGVARINEAGSASNTTDYTNTISTLTIYEIQG